MSILTHKPNQKILSLDCSPDNASNTAAIHLNQLNLITSSAKSALTHGPKLGCPVSRQLLLFILPSISNIKICSIILF